MAKWLNGPSIGHGARLHHSLVDSQHSNTTNTRAA